MAASPPAAPAADPASFWRQLLDDLRSYWPLWLIAAAAIVLRVYRIGDLPGLIGDEAWYGVQAQRLLAEGGGDLRTPTGNVPGLIQTGSLVLLHSLFEPSALLLRLPALASSLAAIAVAYFLGRRFFGSATGVAAMLLVACLPANIAYARLGWDPSHAPLLVLIASWAAFARRRLLAALLFALALANHPAAVFVAPFLVIAFLGFDREQRRLPAALANATAFAAMLGLAILLSLWLSPGAGHYLDASKSLGRLANPALWHSFAYGFCRLISGETIYAFIAGKEFGHGWPNVAVALVLLAVASGLVLCLRRRDWPAAGIVAGWLVSLFLLFVIAGSWVVQPVFERFSVPMIPLTVLAAAVMLGRLGSQGGRRIWLQAVLAIMSLPLLVGFVSHYLRPLERGENSPNAAYWIGLPELNRAAVDRIAVAAGGRRATVMAEDWWIYWPAAYWLGDGPLQPVDAASVPGKLPPGESYWISYRGGPLDRALARRQGFRLLDTVETRDGRNALNIWSGMDSPGA